jgi:hypothetical protein
MKHNISHFNKIFQQGNKIRIKINLKKIKNNNKNRNKLLRSFQI